MLLKERFDFVEVTPLWDPAPLGPAPSTVHVRSWDCAALLVRDVVPSGLSFLLDLGPCRKTRVLNSGRFIRFYILLLVLSLGLHFPELWCSIRLEFVVVRSKLIGSVVSPFRNL